MDNFGSRSYSERVEPMLVVLGSKNRARDIGLVVVRIAIYSSRLYDSIVMYRVYVMTYLNLYLLLVITCYILSNSY